MTIPTDILRAAGNVGYGPRPIPDRRDKEIENLLSRYMARSDSTGDPIDAPLSNDHSSALGAFSERMASLAVRTQDMRLITLGLVALGLATNQSRDVREEILIISLHYAAARKLSADPARIFLGAALYVAGPGKGLIISFLSRSAQDKSLASMGYREGQDADGFRFVRDW